jgi:hypothetical protein
MTDDTAKPANEHKTLLLDLTEDGCYLDVANSCFVYDRDTEAQLNAWFDTANKLWHLLMSYKQENPEATTQRLRGLITRRALSDVAIRKLPESIKNHVAFKVYAVFAQFQHEGETNPTLLQRGARSLRFDGCNFVWHNDHHRITLTGLNSIGLKTGLTDEEEEKGISSNTNTEALLDFLTGECCDIRGVSLWRNSEGMWRAKISFQRKESEQPLADEVLYRVWNLFETTNAQAISSTQIMKHLMHNGIPIHAKKLTRLMKRHYLEPKQICLPDFTQPNGYRLRDVTWAYQAMMKREAYEDRKLRRIVREKTKLVKFRKPKDFASYNPNHPEDFFGFAEAAE